MFTMMMEDYFFSFFGSKIKQNMAKCKGKNENKREKG